jgi:hypothetical protein
LFQLFYTLFIMFDGLELHPPLILSLLLKDSLLLDISFGHLMLLHLPLVVVVIVNLSHQLFLLFYFFLHIKLLLFSSIL